VKVRHYGLLSNRHRDERLALCRRLLFLEGVRAALPEAVGPDKAVASALPIRCPHCGGQRIVCRELPRADPAAQVDSS